MRHLLLFLFSLLPTFLWADNISVEKAQELAITFFKEGHPQRSAFSSLRLLVTDEAVSARAVADLVEQRFPDLSGKVEIYSVGTTIGSHTGPGTVALFFWGDERTE